MRVTILRKLLSAIALLVLPWLAFAEYGEQGIGGLSNGMTSIIGGVATSLSYILLISGIFFVLGAIIKYQNHRQNPSQVRLGEPVFLLVLGLVLIALPFLGYVVGYNPGFF